MGDAIDSPIDQKCCANTNNLSMIALHAKNTLRGGMGLRTRLCLKHTVQLYATKFNSTLLTNLRQSYS